MNEAAGSMRFPPILVRDVRAAEQILYEARVRDALQSVEVYEDRLGENGDAERRWLLPEQRTLRIGRPAIGPAPGSVLYTSRLYGRVWRGRSWGEMSVRVLSMAPETGGRPAAVRLGALLTLESPGGEGDGIDRFWKYLTSRMRPLRIATLVPETTNPEYEGISAPAGR